MEEKEIDAFEKEPVENTEEAQSEKLTFKLSPG